MWMGRTVPQPARVVYAAAEGLYAYQKRVLAWVNSRRNAKIAHLSQLSWTDWTLDLNNPRSTFVADVAKAKPDLVIIDTLASAAPGIVENTSEGVGPLMETLIDLRLKSSVLIVHHTGWDAKQEKEPRHGKYRMFEPSRPHERGFSNLRGAVDTSIEMVGELDWQGAKVKVKPRRMLICHKQKDWERFPYLTFRLEHSLDSLSTRHYEI